MNKAFGEERSGQDRALYFRERGGGERPGQVFVFPGKSSMDSLRFDIYLILKVPLLEHHGLAYTSPD